MMQFPLHRAVPPPAPKPSPVAVATTPAAAPQEIHMSSPFSITSLESKIETGFSDLKKGLTVVEKAITAVTDPTVQNTIEGLTGLTGSVAAVDIEKAAFTALGLLGAAVQSAEPAAAANGINVSLDAATVTAFKTFISQSKAQLAAVGIKL